MAKIATKLLFWTLAVVLLAGGLLSAGAMAESESRGEPADVAALQDAADDVETERNEGEGESELDAADTLALAHTHDHKLRDPAPRRLSPLPDDSAPSTGVMRGVERPPRG